mmetsp:Transcript_2446/g.5319  ORF Transcript_2446/g.5319 Transcript_2446/m.5319 type:complete len:557 (-) Transcript_2446:45-1715(-)
MDQSGILHARRFTPFTNTTENSNANDNAKKNIAQKSKIINREEHIFAWIANSLHIELAMSHLEQNGFDDDDSIVFIPYSNQRNWLDRYPHAEPALAVDETGNCIIHTHKRPYPNGLGRLDENPSYSSYYSRKRKNDCNNGNNGSAAAAYSCGDSSSMTMEVEHQSKERVRTNMLQDTSFLPDLERDELHIEIYNYLKWLHVKLSTLEKKAVEAEQQRQWEEEAELTVDFDAAANSELHGEEDEHEMASADLSSAKHSIDAVDDDVVNDNEDEGNDSTTHKNRNAKNKQNPLLLKDSTGVDLSELQCVLDKLVSTFAVTHNLKKEDEDKWQTKGAPFLEEATSSSLPRLVAARGYNRGSSKRRSRRWQQRRTANNVTSPLGCNRTGNDFEEMFQRLVQYKEEHGDCVVRRGYSDKRLALWVKNIRQKMINLQKEGLGFETIEPRQKIYQSTLTPERVERLNSVGFIWAFEAPEKVSWEQRLRECVEYYEENGCWPPQAMGPLGKWVHRQRQQYTRREPNFMKERVPRLDEVGFEWTPRGNQRFLLEFNKNVKCTRKV